MAVSLPFKLRQRLVLCHKWQLTIHMPSIHLILQIVQLLHSGTFFSLVA